MALSNLVWRRGKVKFEISIVGYYYVNTLSHQVDQASRIDFECQVILFEKLFEQVLPWLSAFGPEKNYKQFM